MPVVAVIGGHWGDEAKGKVVDLLAERAQLVVRFSGGSNAGHTVVNDLGEFTLHLVPAGIFNPQARCVIANGVAVDPEQLLEEMDLLAGRGIDVSRLAISERAHVIMPYHRLLDRLEEEARGKGAIGTTGQGIGPCFADKAARHGVRITDLVDPDAFRRRLSLVLEVKNVLLTRVYGHAPLDLEEICQSYLEYGQRLAPYVQETFGMLSEAMNRGDLILLEGAQGSFLDPDFGTYPYVTSSPPTAAGACLGTGISPRRLDHVLCVFKAYTTRVGAGPLPTELEGELGAFIRERAHEYGATTGRARRCGWFDGVAARFSCQFNGCDSIALTRLDILDVLPAIQFCVGYRVDGRVLDYLPSSTGQLERCEPVYEEWPGWECSVEGARSYDQLPEAARRYLRRIEEFTGCPISIVSVGPAREQTIVVRETLVG